MHSGATAPRTRPGSEPSSHGQGWTTSRSRGGKFGDARQPRVGWARYPYTGPSGYECMPTVQSDERGLSAGTARLRWRCGRLCEPRVPYADCSVGRDLDLRTGRRVAARRCRGRHRLRPAEPGGPRLVPKAEARPRRRGATLCLHQLLRGPRSGAKPVTCKLWDHVDLDGDAPLTADGRRRLVAPRVGAGPPVNVAIVGAGPAGLYLAILLKRDDPRHQVTVYERNRVEDTFGFGSCFPTRRSKTWARPIETNQAMAAAARAGRTSRSTTAVRSCGRPGIASPAWSGRPCWSCSPGGPDRWASRSWRRRSATSQIVVFPPRI